jgi:hypothetical protein
MSNLPAQQPRFPLPKLDDLYSDKQEIANINELNKILNSDPLPSWIKLNPFADNTPYIPIERIEWLLTRIYVKYRVEIKEVKLIANSISVTVRVHVLDPITGEWDWNDGTGAAPLQTAKGAGAIEFDKIKGSAVQMGAPSAESFAVKDAAEKFGKIFGKDIGRKENIDYSQMQEAKSLSLNPPSKEVVEIPQELIDAISLADIPNLNSIYHTNKDEFGSNAEFMKLLTARKNEIRNEKTPA